jgi:hypothetical protein
VQIKSLEYKNYRLKNKNRKHKKLFKKQNSVKIEENENESF